MSIYMGSRGDVKTRWEKIFLDIMDMIDAPVKSNKIVVNGAARTRGRLRGTWFEVYDFC